jgi:hypothetical protein
MRSPKTGQVSLAGPEGLSTRKKLFNTSFPPPHPPPPSLSLPDRLLLDSRHGSLTHEGCVGCRVLGVGCQVLGWVQHQVEALDNVVLPPGGDAVGARDGVDVPEEQLKPLLPRHQLVGHVPATPARSTLRFWGGKGAGTKPCELNLCPMRHAGIKERAGKEPGAAEDAPEAEPEGDGAAGCVQPAGCLSQNNCVDSRTSEGADHAREENLRQPWVRRVFAGQGILLVGGSDLQPGVPLTALVASVGSARVESEDEVQERYSN